MSAHKPLPGSLPIPPEVAAADTSIELLRAWAANGGLHCSLKPDPWNGTPSNWGIVLADVARHVANAVEEQDGTPSQETLRAIVGGFNAELEYPTDAPAGFFLPPDSEGGPA